jgi:hypothetical protein
MSNKFLKDVIERAMRTFLQGFLGAWVAGGADFDGLVSSDNLKIGIVAVALSVAMSIGLKNVGKNKNSASIL